jgi:hypothetical protein
MTFCKVGPFFMFKWTGLSVFKFVLFHPVSNFNTLRHQFESGKTQKTAGRRLSVAIGNTKVTIAITIIQV